MNRIFTKDEINIISVESIRAQINPFGKTIRNNQNDNKTKTMSALCANQQDNDVTKAKSANEMNYYPIIS